MWITVGSTLTVVMDFVMCTDDGLKEKGSLDYVVVVVFFLVRRMYYTVNEAPSPHPLHVDQRPRVLNPAGWSSYCLQEGSNFESS
ncbi:hypothetical protein TorRG33x02_356550 [Trema orientale]|uniref:Uncharacterized protein n=1 Tax=Trema orientale TaxID=63057 RepID=A0A2P5A703_TREOI|nr:hypothetical protein TorRG33x02_356550 [Trema orientale]